MPGLLHPAKILSLAIKMPRRDPRDADIKAPDGYLLGGLRRVRKDGTLLFHRIHWQCPEEWIGKQIWVHVIDPITLDNIEAAPPGRFFFECSFGERILLEPADKPDAKNLFR